MTDATDATATAGATPQPDPQPAIDTRTTAEILRDSIVPSTRVDGWSAAKQKRFLEAVADGETVTDACGKVRLSPQSAYAFRRRPKGRAFDLGWRAADLLARERIAADLLIRATEGQLVEITRADGSTVSRHHYDNRLAVQMLNRLDRYADASERTAPGHAARLVAADFDSYLDLVGDDGGPARAALFMLAREGGDAAASELEPVLALARADRILRCGTAIDGPPVADLDPARRADWTAEQWARAEAAGLLVLAPPPAPEPVAPEPAVTRQPVSTSAPVDPLYAPGSPVWFFRAANQWRTEFPPPEGFMGDEEGDWGDEDYDRALSDEELEALGLSFDSAEALAEAQAERDAWFAAAVRYMQPEQEKPQDEPAAGPGGIEAEGDGPGQAAAMTSYSSADGHAPHASPA